MTSTTRTWRTRKDARQPTPETIMPVTEPYLLDEEMLAKLKAAAEVDPFVNEMVEEYQTRDPEASYERALTVLWRLNAL